MNSVVIALGGLHVRYLGCYGGAWVETPAFDRFASEGFAFDQCFAESPSPAATRRAWWTGCYQSFCKPDEPATAETARPCLIQALRSAGIRTVLVRDTRALVEPPGSGCGPFDQIIEIDRADEDSTARVFEAATRWLQNESARGRFLLFIDCHGAHPPWHPPKTSDEPDAELDEIDEESEVGEETGDSVENDSSGTLEPTPCDAVTDRVRRTSAAVITHLDSELGLFLDFIRGRAEWEQSLVVITSDCGANFADEHGAIVGHDFLNEGRVHVPLLVRVPGEHDPSSRSAALVQSIDLVPTVCDTFGVAIPTDVPGRSLLPIVRVQTRSVRDAAVWSEPGRGWSIRTAAWHLKLPAVGTEPPREPQLFVKPDDRWDRNDVARQYPEVVEQLERRLRSHIGAL